MFPQEAGKSYEEYMEEYYAMDCEDVIGGDLHTRFKYRETVSNDFGLTVEEVMAYTACLTPYRVPFALDLEY